MLGMMQLWHSLDFTRLIKQSNHVDFFLFIIKLLLFFKGHRRDSSAKCSTLANPWVGNKFIFSNNTEK